MNPGAGAGPPLAPSSRDHQWEAWQGAGRGSANKWQVNADELRAPNRPPSATLHGAFALLLNPLTLSATQPQALPLSLPCGLGGRSQIPPFQGEQEPYEVWPTPKGRRGQSPGQ